MLQELLEKLKKLFNKAMAGKTEKPSLKKEVSWEKDWEKVGKKYKTLPYFRIETFDTHQELWFYQKTVAEPVISKYKLPLKIVQIIFIAKFFPKEIKFFRQQLLEAFDKMVKYRRRK